MKKFVNTSDGSLTVYSDSKCTTPVGSLFRGSTCDCIFEQDASVVVLYKAASNGMNKVGFTDYIAGVQDV